MTKDLFLRGEWKVLNGNLQTHLLPSGPATGRSTVLWAPEPAGSSLLTFLPVVRELKTTSWVGKQSRRVEVSGQANKLDLSILQS